MKESKFKGIGDQVKKRKAKTKPEVKPDLQQSAITDNQIEEKPKLVNLSIRVDERSRIHWASQAKLHKVTITQAITEALNDRFGSYED